MTITHGFVLTRHARDRFSGTQIELWLSTEDGPHQLLIDGEKPVFFMEDLVWPSAMWRSRNAIALKLERHREVRG
ncbi:hypothetical protein K6U70_08990, partial [Vibrio vulnificus]|uniref:hypothetical protein n=1 Tax=Vibrio vulnificus TaxID=672 RepID=UPI001EEA06A7